MTGSDFYKIGYTSYDDTAGRIRALQTACPCKLEVVATIAGDEAIEREYHRRFWQYRTNGGDEWFEIPTDKAKELYDGNAKRREDFRPFGGLRPLMFDRYAGTTTPNCKRSKRCI